MKFSLFVYFVLCFLLCSSSSNKPNIMTSKNMNTPLIIAHRGASKEAPENTLSAFKRAIELGADYFELDTHLSADGIPVVCHDYNLKRCTGGKHIKLISELSYKELSKIDMGSWFSSEFKEERLPSLEEVLLLERNSTGIMVEIKADQAPYKPLALAVAELVKKYESKENANPIIVASFAPEIIKIFEEEAPNILLMALADSNEEIEHHLKHSHVKYLGVNQELVNSHLLKRLQKDHIKVWTYTVDKSSRAKNLFRIGIDGIISNDPRLLMAIPRHHG